MIAGHKVTKYANHREWAVISWFHHTKALAQPLYFLRSCLSSCKIIHLLCTAFSILKLFLFDHNLCFCLGRIVQCSVSDASWQHESLPVRFGGLGLCESAISASLAFLGSCSSIHELASTLLSVDNNQLSFLDEKDAATFSSHIFGDHLLCAASQKPN